MLLHCSPFLSLGGSAIPLSRPLASIRDSRFSRLGTETPRLSVQVSSRNRTRNRLQAKRGLGISLGTETMKLQVSVSEPESGYTASSMKTPQKVLLYGKKLSFFPESEPKCRDSRQSSWNRNRTRNRCLGYPRLGIGLGIGLQVILDSESEPESM